MFFRPLISVIVPVYNVEKYLPQCLDSLIKQTFLPFEIICVNDGSTDGCNEILSRYAAKDRRIRLICQNNRGLSAARNAGLKKPKDNMFCLLTATTCCTPKLCRHYTGKLPATMRTFAFSATLRTPTTALKPPTCPPHITEKRKRRLYLSANQRKNIQPGCRLVQTLPPRIYPQAQNRISGRIRF